MPGPGRDRAPGWRSTESSCPLAREDPTTPRGGRRAGRPAIAWRVAESSALSAARSTLDGHSVRQALHDRQLPSTSESSGDPRWSAPKRPSRAARMVLARPRVECASSPVATKVGHMVGASFRQPPQPLHCSRLATNERSRSTKPSSPTSSGASVEPLPRRRSPSMANRPESTILPGFMTPFGSKSP